MNRGLNIFLILCIKLLMLSPGYTFYSVCVSEFVFHVPPTVKVIWIWGYGLESHPIDCRSQGSNSRPLDTKQVVYPLHQDGCFKETVPKN